MAQPIGEILAALRGGPAVELRGSAAAAASTVPAVTDITTDSREVRSGWMFCCVVGDHVDGHRFAVDAVSNGATVLLVDHPLDIDVTQVVVADVRAATGWFAAAVHRHPADHLLTIGVTGTNGKTTTAQLVGDVLRYAGRSVDVFGTLTGGHTTPEAPELQRRLAASRDAGTDAVVLEVSSHALALGRVNGAHFDVAVFTNLGRDHLDLHGTTERYFAAKARLFEAGLSDRGVVNIDDVHGRLLVDSSSIEIDTFTVADLRNVSVDATQHSYSWRGQQVRVGMGGAFNVSNSLAAAETCRAVGLAPELVAAGLASARPVPGRFEPIDAGQPFSVIVDYAHTPDGLREALNAARATTYSRVLVVFGCGGDRDREKRPEMAAAAAEIADMIVVTSDNPRSEDPLAIIDAAVAGVPDDYRGTVVIEPDRRTAIAVAFADATEGDVVVIAGKGHEITQTIGSEVIKFDDRMVARELLAARHPGTGPDVSR